MNSITRLNSRGEKYTLIPKGQNWTSIYCEKNKKEITVNANIGQLNDSWAYWQHVGYKVQAAFQFLNSDEREFIMTGITADEWNEIFGDDLSDY